MIPSKATSLVLRGKPVAEKMEEEARRTIAHRQLSLSLRIVMVGDNPASEAYVAMKMALCARVGIEARIERLSANTTQATLHTLLDALNADGSVTGYIVQMPLPGDLSIAEAVKHFSPAKDVDGFTALNAGKLFLGNDDAFLPPATAHGVMELLKGYDIPLAGKHVVIVGRSNLVGKPLALELLAEDATVTICHSKTANLASHTLAADILVSAVGKKHIITADMVREDAVLVDVGFTKTSAGLFGDIAPEANAKARAYAPVPGGVGAVTVAQLIANVVRAHDLLLT